MNPLLKSIALAVLVNAVMLAIAAFLFGNFTITTAGFAIAVVLFTLLTVVLKELVLGLVKSFVRAYTVVGGLILTWVALMLTDLIVPMDGFHIDGVWTWIGVTVLVWAGAIAYGEVDKKAPEPRGATGS